MKFYLAPLEGITMPVFRNLVHEMFGEHIDKYFTPFIVPHSKKCMTPKERREIDPVNNPGINLVPQIMTVNAADYLNTEKKLMDFGYRELNLNFGCPSNTVSNKGRGSGFLKKPDDMDRFLDEIFSGTNCRISIKTRLGFEHPDEFYRVLEVYNKYPIHELIIHPRVKREMYGGNVHIDKFVYAVSNSTCDLSYNGDIDSVKSYRDMAGRISENFREDIPEGELFPSKVTSVMLGRGMVGNPALIREICGGRKLTYEEAGEFTERFRENYYSQFNDELATLSKLKEIWTFMHRIFPESPETKKAYKKILKSRRISDYESAAAELFAAAGKGDCCER